jgi:hypothetical protein
VFSLRDLTFSNVESTRKTRVVTYNSDTEQTNTYFAENLIVVQWFDSEADIYRKYKAQFDVRDDTGAVLPEDFAYNDAKGRLIRIGDTVKTIEADSVTSRVIGLYSGRVEVDYGGSTTTYVPSFLVVVSKSHDGQPVPPVPQPTVPPVPPEPTVPVPPEPTVPVPPVPTVPVPPVPPKKVEPFVGPRKPTVPTVPQRVQPIVVPIMPTKVLPPPPPDEFYDGEWPLFNQKKMALKPAKETHIETNTGIAVNAFNMFRRRLPGVIGGQVGGAAKILEAQKVGGQAGGGIRREEKKSVTDDDASSTMSSSTNSWDSIEPTGSGGGGGAGILIAGLIVALIIYQSSS